MPAHITRFVEKAHTRGADAICLDLEDAVPPHMKAEARAALPSAIRAAGRAGADILVRINRPWDLAFHDLDAAVTAGVKGILLPKVEAPEDVCAIDRLIEDRERRQGLEPGSIQVGIALETAKGLLRDKEIAGSSPRIRTISSGTEDFATDLELELTDEGWELFYAKARLVLVARANNLEPMGLLGRVSDYGDLDVFRKSALRARGLGYRGANCIHPDQVAVLNEVFSPTESELQRAHQVVIKAQQAEAEGKGAFSVDGQMADIPTVERALRLLRRARLIQERKDRVSRHVDQA
ncbi:MAG: CoA ester lyase [Betaproteobacteria bacterium]|nr:CoA ester lyase [Betaproteobacteria bacterium]